MFSTFASYFMWGRTQNVSISSCCIAFTGCTTVNTDCQCSTLGADACSNLPYTICYDDQCQCLPYTSPSNNNNGCAPDCPAFLYFTDGSTVSPFLSDPNYSETWQTFSGGEPAASNMFGLKANGMILRAQGSVSIYKTYTVVQVYSFRNFANFHIADKESLFYDWNLLNYIHAFFCYK